MLPKLKRVVTVIGSVSSLSRILNTNRSSMYMWRKIPKNLVVRMETAQRDAIKRKERELGVMRRNFLDRHQIRPDVFPRNKKDKKQ